MASKSSEPLRSPVECPANLEELVPLMLRDLPSYANRVSQRAYDDIRTTDTPGYILLAGRPEYEPIAIESREYTPTQADDTSQVFFTTLERQYIAGESVQLQHFHWLFLTQTSNGWRLVLMFSAIGGDSPDALSTPPQDSSQGVIAQAIRLWLRDCQAGSIEPPQN
ncbi:MAG: hypothetical protein HC769_32860 [Cyanobacteria bacterium CRU_2_1]|nr:hypothetical protein [Cyanobacteria bacterium RU_5_0]NJR63153.1 hypothetical protein [Cyanobacteria bacterium CRU_2_1]